MRIHNVRHGHACNSSSSHSMIFLEPGKHPNARLLGEKPKDGQFGWEPFTAQCREDRANYLGISLLRSMEQHHVRKHGSIPYDVEHRRARELRHLDLARDAAAWSEGELQTIAQGDVDHQSVWTFPAAWAGDEVDRVFFDAWKAWVLRDGVIILGGHDNGDGTHPMRGLGEALDLLPCEDRSWNWVARRDDRHAFWTLFSRASGGKVRFSFDTAAKTPTKATFPELVDLKITDHCPYGCAYCYQGSTREGRHASPDAIASIVGALADARVFECAIGGGEPTLHPEFVSILRALRAAGVVPNFTTRNLAWVRGPDADEILDTIGAFAYSVESARDVEALVEACRMITLGGRKPLHTRSRRNFCVAQHVVGVAPMDEMETIVRACAAHHIPLTLLGYKTTGRGDDFTPHPHDDWFVRVVRLRREGVFPLISIDTTLAERFENEIVAAGIPRWMFHTEEGKFSAYVDAVERVVAPSSYCDPSLRRPLDTVRFRECFAGM